MDSAPPSASLIFLVNETVSGVVFAPFVFVSLIWKPLVQMHYAFFELMNHRRNRSFTICTVTNVTN